VVIILASTNIKNPIMGKSQASSRTMTEFVQKINSSFNPQIAEAYLRIGAIYGVKGDVALSQAILETNWFRYGGDVRAEQNNFAGLGAVGGGTRGASFSTIEEGVRAHIQHLFAYATKDALPAGETIVDPRFQYVTRGSAPNWEDLGGKWAIPGYDTKLFASFEEAYGQGQTYGQKIIIMFNSLLVFGQQQQIAKAREGFPSNTPQYRLEAVAWLYEKGYLTGEQWKQKVDEPLPLWALALVLKRLYDDIESS
jgi:hypothetical protein